MSTMVDKKADLAGPGIGNYEELEKILPPRLQLSAESQGHAARHHDS